MERKGATLIKKVKVLSRESKYNKQENSNLEEMIKNLDQNLQQIAFENLRLKEDKKFELQKKEEEVESLKLQLESTSHQSGPKSPEFGSSSTKKKRRRLTDIFSKKNSTSSNSIKTPKSSNNHNKGPKTFDFSDKITERLNRLISENQKLKKENERLKDSWIQKSENGSGLLFGGISNGVSPGQSLFRESNSNFSSINKELEKDRIYEAGKNMKKKKRPNKRWGRKEKKREDEASLNRTTLRKRLEKPEGDASRRYSKYHGVDEREKYCNLI